MPRRKSRKKRFRKRSRKLSRKRSRKLSRKRSSRKRSRKRSQKRNSRKVKFDVKVTLGKNEAVEYKSPSPSTWSKQVKKKIQNQVMKIMNKWLRLCASKEKANVTWKKTDTLTVECPRIRGCEAMQRKGKRHVKFISVAQSFPTTIYRINKDYFELLFKVY